MSTELDKARAALQSFDALAVRRGFCTSPFDAAYIRSLLDKHDAHDVDHLRAALAEVDRLTAALAEAERDRDAATFLARKQERAYAVAYIERAALRCHADDRDDAFVELRGLACDIESGTHESIAIKETP